MKKDAGIMNSQLTVLVVSQVFPYPPHDGGRVDIYYRLKALKSNGYRVLLVAFYNPRFPDLDISLLQECCDEIYPIPILSRKLSNIIHVKPYFICSRENHFIVDEVVQSLQNKEKIDIVLSESHHVLTVSNILKTRLRVEKHYLRVHNNEAKFMLSVAKSSPLFSLNKPFFLLESFKYFCYEKSLLQSNKLDALLHISFEECLAYQKKYPQIKHCFLPAAVDLATLKSFKPKNSKNVLFVGALFAPNNIHGLFWYLKNVHKFLEEEYPDYKLIIAGNTQGANRSNIDKILRNSQNIQLIETPSDLDSVYEKASVFINPMQYGAGVKIKNVNAIINAVPVVTTSIGNEGTGFKSNQHLSVCKTSTDFKNAVCDLLKDSDKQVEFVQESQEFLKKHYDQAALLKEVLESKRLPADDLLTI